MLNKQNFQIAELAPADEERLTMCGILVSPERTCVTDGHMAVIVSSVTTAQPSLFSEAEGVEPADFFSPFILDRESALKIAKAIPKNSEDSEAVFPVIDATTENNDRAMVSINDVYRQEILRARKISGDFPAVEKVIPDKDSALFSITFNCELLLRVLKAVNKFGSGPIEMRLYGAGKPLRIDAGDLEQTLIAVVMPLRNDGPTEGGTA